MPEGPFGGPRPWAEGAARVNVDDKFIGSTFERETGSFNVFIQFNKRVTKTGFGRATEPVIELVEREMERNINTDVDISTVLFKPRMLEFTVFSRHITEDSGQFEIQLILAARSINKKLRERHEQKILSNIRLTLQIEEIFTSELTNIRGDRDD